MNYKKHTHTFVIMTLTGIVTTFAIAPYVADAASDSKQGFQHTSRDFGPHRIFKLLHRLDVSREQQRAMGEIMDKHRPQMREFMFDMKDSKKALHAILVSPDYDPQQIESLAASQAKNAEKMFLATAKTFAELSAILTPEQRAELAEMMEERRGARWRKRDHGDASL